MAAALQLAIADLECDYFELTPARGKHTGERLGRFRVQPGEVLLADAGYSHPPGISAVVSRGADLIVRLVRDPPLAGRLPHLG